MLTDDEQVLVKAFRAGYLAGGGETPPSDERVLEWLDDYVADTIFAAESAGTSVALDELESE